MPIIAQYPFSEGSGTVAHDTSGGSHDLTLARPSWTTGHTDNAIDTGGSSADPIATGAIPANSGGAWTVMGWFSAAGSPEPLQLLTIVAGDSLRAEILAAPASSHTYVRLYASDGSTQWYSGANDPGTNWSQVNHVAFTVEPGATLTIYINGTANTPFTSSSDVALDDWDTIRLGGQSGRFASPASGWVDDLRIFNETLTADDIATYMNTPVPPYEASTVTNKIRIGGNQPSGFRIGSTAVNAIYLGSTLIYG